MFLLFTLVTVSCAHSWVEQIQVIGDNDHYSGSFGYPRGYVPRESSAFSDAAMTYLLPAAEEARTRISIGDLVCAPSQRTVNYSRPYAMLSAMPANYIAIKYLENGHVSLPNIPLGKPEGGGIVSVYSILNSNPSTTLTTALSWKNSGSLISGRLLTSQHFDDGRCYQLNAASPISISRQLQYPDPIPGQPGALHEQWCETNVQVPQDASHGQILTMYWVWQWPTQSTDLGGGKDEFYTTCFDILVDIPSNQESPTLAIQDPQTVAVEGYKSHATQLLSL
jgi:hypothetical protein